MTSFPQNAPTYSDRSDAHTHTNEYKRYMAKAKTTWLHPTGDAWHVLLIVHQPSGVFACDRQSSSCRLFPSCELWSSTGFHHPFVFPDSESILLFVGIAMDPFKTIATRW